MTELSIEILTRNCPNCKKEFQTYDLEKIFCGKVCKQEHNQNMKN